MCERKQSDCNYCAMQGQECLLGEFAFMVIGTVRNLGSKLARDVTANVYFGSAQASIYPCVVVFNVDGIEVRVWGAMDNNGRIAALRGMLPDGEAYNLLGKDWFESMLNATDFVLEALRFYLPRISNATWEADKSGNES